FLFFFSSRRRHTRCYRDWSSDVCSSDLAAVLGPLASQDHLKMRHRVAVLVAVHSVESEVGDMVLPAGIEAAADLDMQSADGFVRSEERRVGKECRSRWGASV